MSSVVPSRSAATISCAPQLANQRRPSCQRGDSPTVRPLSKTRGSVVVDIESVLRLQSVSLFRQTGLAQIDSIERRLLEELGDQAGPTRLVAGAHAAAG